MTKSLTIKDVESIIAQVSEVFRRSYEGPGVPPQALHHATLFVTDFLGWDQFFVPMHSGHVYRIDFHRSPGGGFSTTWTCVRQPGGPEPVNDAVP